MAWEDAMNMNV